MVGSEFCIFHDSNYIKEHYDEYEVEAVKRLEKRIQISLSKKEPLQCIGYAIPSIEFAKYFMNFLYPVYFNRATFHDADFSGARFAHGASFCRSSFHSKADFSGAEFFGKANFSGVTFSDVVDFNGAKFFGEAHFQGSEFSSETNYSGATFFDLAYFFASIFNYISFTGSKFSREASFSKSTFCDKTYFNGSQFLMKADFTEAIFSNRTDFSGAVFSETWPTLFQSVIFEQPGKVFFNDNNLSNVSFTTSDITRVRFGPRVRWGGKDYFRVIEEEWLRKNQPGTDKSEHVTLDLVLSVYRNLRESYEYQLRYDEAGKFFIKEMELKRNYRRAKSGFESKRNCWFRRNLSLIGIYHFVSDYGESIKRPSLIGALMVFCFMFVWVTQSNPILEPQFVYNLDSNESQSYIIGLSKVGNLTHLSKSVERTITDLLPILPLGGEFKVGLIDYAIKILGTVFVFGLLIIALRRKLERKYTR